MFYSFIRAIVQMILYLVNGKPKILNKEKLPEGNYILVGPHRTWFDPLYFALSARPKKFSFMAKKELFKNNSFDVITSNPPYMIGKHGIKNPDEPKAIARHEIKCNLDDIIREGSRLLKANGRFYMIHRPFRLVEIFETFTKYGLEPKRMRMVQPFVDKEPNMVLIEALKGGKSHINVETPLIVYDEPQKYTEEIYKIYGYKE